jgi:hypothetical protein
MEHTNLEIENELSQIEARLSNTVFVNINSLSILKYLIFATLFLNEIVVAKDDNLKNNRFELLNLVEDLNTILKKKKPRRSDSEGAFDASKDLLKFKIRRIENSFSKINKAV